MKHNRRKGINGDVSLNKAILGIVAIVFVAVFMLVSIIFY